MLHRSTSALLLAAMFVALALPASATRKMVQEFQAKYAATKYFEKGNHGCMLCHVDVAKSHGKLTPYGKDFKAQKGKPAERFAKIEKLDSDKDGFSNLDEIKAGTSPADPKDNPKTPAQKTAATTGTLTMHHHAAATTATAAMQHEAAQAPAAPKAKHQGKHAAKKAAGKAAQKIAAAKEEK